ncbi:GEVED domain-containing protein [Luteimonas sp. R10]|uniref:prealbumin-like fold domain-containing protein n=1 Tax=Luteimonas sp. R10 TaxID=3108176 RepID=UPI003093DF05|nr:DUF11 domain-containing protein [Luteimonas sp. R10]
MSMKATSRPSHRRAAMGVQCCRRNVIAILLVGLAVLLGIGPAFADEFYFTRTRSVVDAQSGATGLFLWDDATNSQIQIGGDAVNLRHATDGPMYVDGIATGLAGALYGFAVDDTADVPLFPFSNQGSCSTSMRSRLVSIDTGTGIFTYVGNWLAGRRISGAAFDGSGRLWAIDCVSGDVVEISPATGQVVGGSISLGSGFSYVSDLDFAANGMGIVGYGEMQFLVFDPNAGWVASVPIPAQNSGFDSGLVNPYAVVGAAFTQNLSARNGSPQADACRLNIAENRGGDELGHANDPFFANPVIVRKEADQYNPPNLPASQFGWYNGGPGDAARAGGPALPDCFYDWGDAPTSYGTLLAANGARHAIVAGSPYLGAGQPDFEVDGQPNAGATGDDGAGTNDEDGVTVPALPVGATVQIEVTAGNVGPDTLLQGWIDWAGDGSFAQTGDQVLIDAALVSGTNTFDIAVPATATVGTTYARFRIANQAGLGFDGLAGSGEVEDHQVQVTAGQADLAITKDDGSDTYVPGLDVIYTIVVSNNGPSAVTGAQVSDPLPTGITSASWTCGAATGGGACGAPSGTGAIDTTADLPAGASVTYTMSLAIPASRTGSLVNTATVAPPDGMTDANLDNNEASDTDTMEPPPTSGACAPREVAPGATFSLAPFANGGTVTKSAGVWATAPTSEWTKLGGNYTLTWNFSQPIPADWLQIILVDIDSVSPNGTLTISLGGGVSTNQIVKVGGDLLLGAGGVVRRDGAITGDPGQSGTFRFAPGGTLTSITITSANIHSTDNIGNRLQVRPACLTLEKLSEGGAGAFTIDMTNVAQADGTAVPSTTLTTTTPGTPVSSTMLFFSPVPGAVMAMTEVVPQGWDNTLAVCTDQNAGVTGNPTVIGSFASPTISIPADNVRPQADIHCRFTNQQAEADLAITKDDGSDTYVPGLDVIYTIVVSNNGPSAVTGAQVSDPLPTGITNASWTCGNATGGGSCGAPSGTGAINTTADLPTGASVTYYMSIGIPPSFTGSLSNTATVSAPDGVTDTNLDNNEASDTNTMEPPPTSGACSPVRVMPTDGTFSLAPLPITGSVTKGNGNWQPNNWTAFGGNFTITWTFSQPVPVSWIRFTTVDYGHASYQTATPPSTRITFGPGSTATPADLARVEGELAYNPSTGTLSYDRAGPLRQQGVMQGTSTRTVTSFTLTGSNIWGGDYIAHALYAVPACLTLEKVSEGGTGAFTFDMTNVAEVDGTVVPSTTLTTTTPGTPVAAAMLFFSPTPGAVMSMTETVPPGWDNTLARCTDQNAGVTGNPTIIGDFASPTITIPADNVRPQADIHCRFTNDALPAADLAIVKTVTPEDVAPGDEVVYTIEVTNNGPEAADEAIVTDPGVPDSLECTALACSAAGGAACPAAPTPAQLAAGLVIPTFPNGGTVTLELTCTVTATGTP